MEREREMGKMFHKCLLDSSVNWISLNLWAENWQRHIYAYLETVWALAAQHSNEQMKETW